RFNQAAALAFAALGLAAGAARAGPRWTYSIAAATTIPYGYRPDESDALLAPDLSVSASGARALTRHASLVIAGGYRGYRHTLGLAYIPETPPTTGTLWAEYLNI